MLRLTTVTLIISTLMMATMMATDAHAQDTRNIRYKEPVNFPNTQTSALDAALWDNRVLIICDRAHAITASPFIQRTFNAIDWAGYAERDLIVIAMGQRDIHTWMSPNGKKYVNESQFYARYNARLKCSDNAPQIILVGKDGGVKARWDKVVANDRVFNTIDAMPMRMQEIRQSEKRRQPG